MSKLIDRAAITKFEKMEKQWLEDDEAYSIYWNRKFEDEKEYWDWMEERADKLANSFSQLTGLGGQYFAKLKAMLREAAMTGFFFGELRWQDDIRTLIDSALSPDGE